MTSRQISLVQDSFQLVQPILEDAAMLFYRRLFELDPSLRSLFQILRTTGSRGIFGQSPKVVSEKCASFIDCYCVSANLDIWIVGHEREFERVSNPTN